MNLDELGYLFNNEAAYAWNSKEFFEKSLEFLDQGAEFDFFRKKQTERFKQELYRFQDDMI